jgi:hypothetical protein
MLAALVFVVTTAPGCFTVLSGAGDTASEPPLPEGQASLRQIEALAADYLEALRTENAGLLSSTRAFRDVHAAQAELDQRRAALTDYFAWKVNVHAESDRAWVLYAMVSTRAVEPDGEPPPDETFLVFSMQRGLYRWSISRVDRIDPAVWIGELSDAFVEIDGGLLEATAAQALLEHFFRTPALANSSYTLSYPKTVEQYRSLLSRLQLVCVELRLNPPSYLTGVARLELRDGTGQTVSRRDEQIGFGSGGIRFAHLIFEEMLR